MALFNRKKKENLETEITQPVAEEHTSDGTAEEGELVATTLSYHPDWELTNQEKYVYQFKHQQLPLLKENQISITGVRLIEYNDGFVAVAFLRNTLAKSVRFEAVDLLLLDENDQPIAKKQFELDGLGELPARTCRPWRFLFTNEDKLSEKIPTTEGWKMAFELKQSSRKHTLDLAESWEQRLSQEQKDQLTSLVAGLPVLKPGEINFTGVNAAFNREDDTLAVTVLIRNGNDKNIQLEQIPLVVEDAADEIVAKGGFTLTDFEVKANTSKPWTFIFPKELILKEDADLSSWKVYPPNQE